MVKVISRMKVKKGQVDTFIELFKEMVEPTKKEEECIQYEMYRDEEEPYILTVVERWVTRDGFDRHLLTEHFKKIVPAMSELMEGEADITICRRIV